MLQVRKKAKGLLSLEEEIVSQESFQTALKAFLTVK